VELFLFLFKVFVISFSGAMQPGPVTATAIAAGSRNRYAGLALAAGHSIIEFPLMVLIILGLGRIFELKSVQIAIGLAGGLILLVMAGQMFLSVTKSADYNKSGALDKKPVLAGIILTASNPYFLLWWGTVGLALATEATSFGIRAFGLFVIVHWLCDAVWYLALSWTSFKGTKLLGPAGLKLMLRVCSVALGIFGLLFIWNAAGALVKLF